MAKYTPQTWTDGVSSASGARMMVIEQGIREASMGRSTTFPASPVDGDIHVYPADLTNGVMWMFMYRSAVNDWEFLGGSPLIAEVATAETTTSTTYAALATAGPLIALPFAGDWVVEIGAYISNSGDGNSSLMSYDIGATAAVDADALEYARGTSLSAMGGTFLRRKQGFTAVTLTPKYRVSAGIGTFKKRRISVLPVRHTP